MCLLQNILNAVPKLRMSFCRGFTIVLSRRVAMTILSLLMIVMLLMSWTVAPLLSCHALITELTLVGGGEMTLSALLDLLMVAFGAAGMDGAVRNQAAATGTQTVPYIGQLLNRYLDIALDSTIPLPVWGRRVFDGLFTLANGTLFLDSDATAAVADFQLWAWDAEGGNLSTYAVIGDATDDYLLIDGIRYPVFYFDIPVTVNGTTYLAAPTLYDSTYDYYLAVGNTGISETVAITVCAVQSGNDYSVRWCPNTTGYYRSINTNGSYAGNQFSVNANTWVQRHSFNYISNPQFRVLGPVVDAVPANPWSYDIHAGAGSAIGDADTFVGPMQQGQGAQLPLGDAVTVSSDTAATMHLLNYLRAAASAYAGTGTAQVPVTDVDTGEDELLPLSVPLDSPIGVTGVTDTAIDQSGAVAGTDAVAGDFAGTDDFTMDLTQFFPFCIPFDIYALYAKFEAEAVAPVIDWPIPIPGQDEPSTIHLDFSVFDSLAVWVRRLELIAFAVGLMFLTKHLIQGGD